LRRNDELICARLQCGRRARASKGSDDAGCLCKTADAIIFPAPSRLLWPLWSAASAVAGYAPWLTLQCGTTYGTHDLGVALKIGAEVVDGGLSQEASVAEVAEMAMSRWVKAMKEKLRMELALQAPWSHAGSAVFRGARRRDLQQPACRQRIFLDGASTRLRN
jgi:hypothetical protein